LTGGGIRRTIRPRANRPHAGDSSQATKQIHPHPLPPPPPQSSPPSYYAFNIGSKKLDKKSISFWIIPLAANHEELLHNANIFISKFRNISFLSNFFLVQGVQSEFSRLYFFLRS
jgi:hypothetical protein